MSHSGVPRLRGPRELLTICLLASQLPRESAPQPTALKDALTVQTHGGSDFRQTHPLVVLVKPGF